MPLIFWVCCLFVLSSCSIQNRLADIGNHNRFDSKQEKIIGSGNIEEPIRLWTLGNYSDSLLLRTRCKRVGKKLMQNSYFDTLVMRMKATVQDTMNPGVGIAAPQVGILKRLIWVQRFDKEGMPFEYYINPKITQYSIDKQECLEGCLSIPGKRGTTQTRSYTIKISYRDKYGEKRKEVVDGFTAVIFQHEIDHLNGILFIDHLKTEKVNKN